MKSLSDDLPNVSPGKEPRTITKLNIVIGLVVANIIVSLAGIAAVLL